jgi:hypothetical protein
VVVSGTQEPRVRGIESQLQMDVPVPFSGARHHGPSHVDARGERPQPGRPVDELGLVGPSAGRSDRRARCLLGRAAPARGAQETDQRERDGLRCQGRQSGCAEAAAAVFFRG